MCEIDNRIAGYAYAAQHNARTAYQWSVNLSVYINNQYQGKGLAGVLYNALFEILGALGYFNAYAGIALPNARSEKLHRSLGFKPAGIYRHAGFNC